MVSWWQGIRKWWAAWLATLSKANKESYGAGRMDCCGLGKAPRSGLRRR